MQSYYIHESHRWHFTCVLDGKPIRFFCVFIRDSHSCLWHYLGPTEGLIHGFLSLATMICPVKLLTACCLSINHFPLAATVHPELWNPFPLKKKKHESNCRCLSLSLHYLLLPNVTRPKALDDWWPNVKAFRTELEHKSTEISSSHSGHKTCILSYNGGFQSTLVHHWKTAASCLPQGRHFLYHSFVVLSCSMCPKEPRERGKQTQAMCLGQSNAGFLSLGFIDFFKTRH